MTRMQTKMARTIPTCVLVIRTQSYNCHQRKYLLDYFYLLSAPRHHITQMLISTNSSSIIKALP